MEADKINIQKSEFQQTVEQRNEAWMKFKKYMMEADQNNLPPELINLWQNYIIAQKKVKNKSFLR